MTFRVTCDFCGHGPEEHGWKGNVEHCWHRYTDDKPCPCTQFKLHESYTRTSLNDTNDTTNTTKTEGNNKHMSTDTSSKPKGYMLPDGREYITRPLPGFENDVEGLRQLRKEGTNVLLMGEPGCGKTALLMAAFPDAENEIGHDKLTAPDMLWRPRIDPSSEHGVAYDPSPLNRAVTQGKPFYFDEIMRANQDAMTPLYSAMDGRGFIVGGQIDGTDLPVKKGFVVIGASNPLVRGAFLPDAIASRFHILNVETSEALLKKFNLDERLIVAWNNLSGMNNGEIWRPSIRELLAAQKFIDSGNVAQAAYALTGWRVPARDRHDVALVISSLLGVRVSDLGGVIK